MSIADTKVLVEEGLRNAYTSLEGKGATMPTQKNIMNLAETIASIQGGGGTLGATIVDYPFEVADDTIVYTFASSSDDVFVSASGGKGLYKFNKVTKAFELLVADWTCMEFFEDSRGNVFFSGTNLGQDPQSASGFGGETYWLKKSSLTFSGFDLKSYMTNFIETETYLYCQNRAYVNNLTKYAFNYETEEMSQISGGLSGQYLKYKDQNGYVYAFNNGFEIIEGTVSTSLGIKVYSETTSSIHETSDGKIIFIYKSPSVNSCYVILVDPVNKTYTSLGAFTSSYYYHKIDEYNGMVFGYFMETDDKRLTNPTGIIRRFDFENNKLVEAYSGTSACVLQTLITPMNEYFAFGNQGSQFILKYDNETNLFVRLATTGTAPISYVMFDNGDFVYTQFTGKLYKYTQSTNAVTSLNTLHFPQGEYVAYKSNEYMAFCNVDINKIMTGSSVSAFNDYFGIHVAPVTATGYADFSNFITSGGYFVSGEDENSIYFDNAQLAKRVKFNKADKTFSELEVKSTNPMKDYNVSVPHYDNEPSVLFNANNESMLLDDKYTVAINKENVGIAVSKKKLIMV